MALIAQGQFIIKKLSDSYLLEVSDKIVNKTNAGVLTPSGVSARAYKIVGNSRVELSNATIKLFSGSGETAVPYTSGQVYAIKSTDILLKWQLIISSVVVVQESTAIIENGKDGDKGDQGLPGALVRSRGEWKPYTQYVNNSQYRDTVIYNKNKYIVKSTHTSGSTFDPAQWEDFNEFINVATQVLLADKAWIDILNTQGIAVGSDAANRWELTAGKIRHTRTGLELTADGKIVAPPGGITFSSGKTVEEAIQDKVDAIEVGGRNYVRVKDIINGNDFYAIDISLEPGQYVYSGNCQFEAWYNNGSFIYENPIKITVSGIYRLHVRKTVAFAFVKLKVERGNKPTDWSPAPEDIDYLTEAIQGDTVLNGGLVMSNVIAVRNVNDNTEESIVAGMSGLKDDGVFFFADVKNAYRKAVNYFKGLSTVRPMFGVSKLGHMVSMSALIGIFRVKDDLVTIRDATGTVDKIKFTPKTIDEIASQAGSSAGGTLGQNWSKSGSTRGNESRLMLSHSYNNPQKSIYAIRVVSSEELKTSVRSMSLDSLAVATAYVSLSMRYVVKCAGAVIHENVLSSFEQSCYTNNMDINGNGVLALYDEIQIDETVSLELPVGTISVELYADLDYSTNISQDSDGYWTQANADLLNKSGRIELISTDDETIFGSDGLSIRLTANKMFKLFKKSGEINLIYKGNVSPDSNIPHLICGAQVSSNCVMELMVADDSYVESAGTGRYRVRLPGYMAGKSNYIVQLTAGWSDNIITLDGKDSAYNCFYVATWQSPGVRENSAFTYMVYRAR